MILQNFMTASILFVFLISCNLTEDKEKYNHISYSAVHNKDTANLSININDKRFYGRYEILYHKIGKDSGDVRGDIKGDTLRGDFHFISNGGSWKRTPLSLLKKENILYQGQGVIGTYFNLPCFVPDQPIEYDKSEFVFGEVRK